MKFVMKEAEKFQMKIQNMKDEGSKSSSSQCNIQ